jgi:hypothetical protein
VQQLSDAESAAASVLRDATVRTLHCEGDPGPLYSVAATAAAIPTSLLEPRRQAAERLSAVGKEISSMVIKFKSAEEALSRACGALDWMADKKRSLVARAFSTHEVACEEADRTYELLVRLSPLPLFLGSMHEFSSLVGIVLSGSSGCTCAFSIHGRTNVLNVLIY